MQDLIKDETMPRLPDWFPDRYGGSFRFAGLDTETGQAYLDKLARHIGFVVMAGRALGVPERQLMQHDRSKLSAAEFPFYARWKQDPDGFARAWLHHQNHNKHHWNYWIFPLFYTPKGSSVENGIVEMPENYALEMIADWLGAGRAYEGQWDMSDWLRGNMPRIYLHSRTAEFVRAKLTEIGYGEIANSQPFGSETLHPAAAERIGRPESAISTAFDQSS